jgi:hypothetical protein
LPKHITHESLEISILLRKPRTRLKLFLEVKERPPDNDWNREEIHIRVEVEGRTIKLAGSTKMTVSHLFGDHQQ